MSQGTYYEQSNDRGKVLIEMPERGGKSVKKEGPVICDGG